MLIAGKSDGDDRRDLRRHDETVQENAEDDHAAGALCVGKTRQA